MIDFSKAEGSRNHKSSFDHTAKNIIDHVTELENSYQQTWANLERVRKERAAIIEDIILLVKNNKIKLEKPLSRCNNDELNTELLDIVDTLPFELREKIQISLIKINNRYSEILKYGNELENIMKKLSKIKLLEHDYQDEVVITEKVEPSDILQEAQQMENELETVLLDVHGQKDDEELEEVVSIKKASEELIADLYSYTHSKEELTNGNKDDEYIENYIPFENIEDEIKEEPLSEEEELDRILDFINKNDNLKTIESEAHTLDGVLSLMDIANDIYGDPLCWHLIYNYRDNSKIIDLVAQDNGVSIETVVSNPKYLNGTEIFLPDEINLSENEDLGLAA